MVNNILIYGYHIINEALLSNNIKIIIILIDKKKKNIKKYILLINKLIKKNISIKYLDKNNLDKILYKKNNNKKKINHQGLISYIYFKKKYILNNIIKNKKKLIILILDNINDTKNIGSIIRTSVCLNVNLIIIQKNYYIYNSKIIKISSGAIFKIPICREKNIENTIKFFKKNKIKIISITEKSKKNCINYFNINNIYKNSIALILGNEEKGISNNILKLSDDKIKIPILYNKISSLNVSVACGIILYELNRNLNLL
ncbi:MAG: 23S rRNA (guanosine(2251)-2'-O)-methyltransferase RlmB [Candidatus Shikimatogenerans bostrichidophilus]|nr:MAG: 23S rRNA (guanosine(2251)-2'-O)-methyltransferase RlmB [Candidatus Shikimatogenerans bostrichidophilus]